MTELNFEEIYRGNILSKKDNGLDLCNFCNILLEKYYSWKIMEMSIKENTVSFRFKDIEISFFITFKDRYTRFIIFTGGYPESIMIVVKYDKIDDIGEIIKLLNKKIPKKNHGKRKIEYTLKEFKENLNFFFK